MSALARRMTLFAAAFLLVVVVLAGNAQAVPIFSCPDPAKCNGATYAVEITQVGPQVGTDDYTLDYWINTTGYNGNPTDFIKAVQVKNFANFSNVTAETLTDAPGGVSNWDFIQNELNANGCAGGNIKVLCTQANAGFNGGKGYPFTIGEQLQWTFTFTYPDPPNSTAHIKFLYVDADGKKNGSLGSFDVPVQGVCEEIECDVTPVPEPATLTLLGLGLAAVGARRFRRKRPE